MIAEYAFLTIATIVAIGLLVRIILYKSTHNQKYKHDYLCWFKH